MAPVAPQRSHDEQLVKKGLTIIATHTNADFDAMASMLAAQKLYPGALVVFPGSQEKNLRNFFIQSLAYLYNLVDFKDIEIERIERLVLVDTRKVNRIGRLSEALDNPDLEIHIYDHHPINEGDLKGHQDIHRITGATVTLLTEIIRKRKIHLSAEEATILCLGIYEDTGSFTFSSTTEKDLEAAAFLVAKGANINVIASMIAREISPEQIVYLNDMIQAANRITINGIEIVVTTVTFDQYLPDFAFLVHKMAKMEDINAIFALALMENKIYIVGRSRTGEVDVGEIISTLGGGGHPTAAAATIKGQTLAQVEQALLSEIQNKVKGLRRARHLMSSPPIMIDDLTTCAKANNLMTQYNINALLVTAGQGTDKKLSGFISRQVIEKAIHHELGDVPVKDYMTTEFLTTSLDAELIEVQEKIIGNKQRILPVIDDDQVVGVITRNDLLALLVQHSQLTSGPSHDPFRQTNYKRSRNISNFMKERLPERVLSVLKSIGTVADEMDCSAFVVGGFVRDLFLYRSNEDIDIVVEGDGIAYAKSFAKRHNARIHTHKAFGTAVIIFSDGFKIDVASARMEYYQSPAALPNVEMSSIKLDLFRRDFTINTLAIHLNPSKFGHLIDFFSAQKDIKDQAIRVLHNLSFVEDPTRVFRALRFEQRFDFAIGKLTASLIDNAVRMDFFKRLSGRRVFTEIRLLLEEENPVPAIERMHDFNLLQVIHPSIVLDKRMLDLLNGINSVIAWHDLLFTEATYMRWTVYFMALIHPCDPDVSTEICTKLELAPKYTKLLCQERFEATNCLNGMEQELPETDSKLYRLLNVFQIELILYMMAATQSKRVRKAISRYYNVLRQTQVHIDGKDLIHLGLKPGPVFKQLIESVLDERLNGNIESRDEEIIFVKQWIKHHARATTPRLVQR